MSHCMVKEYIAFWSQIIVQLSQCARSSNGKARHCYSHRNKTTLSLLYLYSTIIPSGRRLLLNCCRLDLGKGVSQHQRCSIKFFPKSTKGKSI